VKSVYPSYAPVYSHLRRGNEPEWQDLFSVGKIPPDPGTGSVVRSVNLRTTLIYDPSVEEAMNIDGSPDPDFHSGGDFTSEMSTLTHL